MTINAVLPGIHLLQSRINGYKKVIYFVLSLFFVPSVFIIHGYLDIPLNNELFVNHVRGFQLLYNNKYNSLYIKSNSNVLFHDNLIFINNDSAIRNLNRILIPLYLFGGDKKANDLILFIDGNQKFFRNSAIAYFNNYHVLDYVPERKVDYNTLPLSGNQKYVSDKDKLVNYINRKNSQYDMIVDLPNILDQRFYKMRYSGSYYSLIKRAMKDNGIFAQVSNINHVNKDYITKSVTVLKNHFNKVIGFQCSDQLLIMASKDVKRLIITATSFSMIQDLFKNNGEMIYLFYNENHLLSHCLFSDISKIMMENDTAPGNAFLKYIKADSFNLNENWRKAYLSSGSEFLALIPDDYENSAFKRNAQYELQRNNELYTLLKTAELAGVERDFEKEAETLSIIENRFRYREDLRKFISQIFSMKKDFYFNTAIELEKEKKWEDAKKLYSALLKIDKTHFDANYRMGLLFITLQNMTDAFTYMKQAMNLKNDDPRVQYQMGVLLFSSGKAQEALKYLDRALELKQDSASLYLYMGFCYEEMGKYFEAKNYYQKAVLKDPNDSNGKLSIDRINLKIQDEVDKWKTKDPTNQNEAEQGENIPLPINKSAYDWRISDEEAKKMK
jgi:Tfp pilus assembly protein PilF